MNNLNDSKTEELTYRIEHQKTPKATTKDQIKLFSKIKKNLRTVVIERISGRTGEC